MKSLSFCLSVLSGHCFSHCLAGVKVRKCSLIPRLQVNMGMRLIYIVVFCSSALWLAAAWSSRCLLHNWQKWRKRTQHRWDTTCLYCCTVLSSILPPPFPLSPSPPPPPHTHTHTQIHTAVIFPGSPLQLPFVIFGLGETPNFIEALIIGAGHPGGTNGSQRVSGRHQWSSLVPNSQVVVITTPPDNPGRYTYHWARR